MVRINSLFYVKAEADAKQVKQIAQQLIEQSRLENGCISYDLFQSSSSQNCLMFCETWSDKEAFNAHLNTKHYTSIMPRIQQFRVGDKELKILEY